MFFSFFNSIAPTSISVYLHKDSKNKIENVKLWTWLGIVSGIISFFTGIMGLGVNLLVLGIYLLKTNRKIEGIISIAIFIIISIILIVFLLVLSTYSFYTL